MPVQGQEAHKAVGAEGCRAGAIRACRAGTLATGSGQDQTAVNREIYFRGWSTARKRWVYGYLVVMDRTGRHYIYEPGNSLLVVPESVGQYTGYRDKQLVRIFEGD